MNDDEPRVSTSRPAHPIGTFAILGLYLVLFALGFLALYFFEFLGRGGPHP